MSIPRADYHFVGAGATDQTLGPSGKKGDFLWRLVINKAGGVGTVAIRDGNGPQFPISGGGGGGDAFALEIGAFARNSTTPGWKVTTTGTATVLAVGRFT